MAKVTDTTEHESFCKKDGWVLCAGKKHKKYRKEMPDGRIKQTSISHGYKEYSKMLFGKILKEQLQVTEDYYFESVK